MKILKSSVCIPVRFRVVRRFLVVLFHSLAHGDFCSSYCWLFWVFGKTLKKYCIQIFLKPVSNKQEVAGKTVYLKKVFSSPIAAVRWELQFHQRASSFSAWQCRTELAGLNNCFLFSIRQILAQFWQKVLRIDGFCSSSENILILAPILLKHGFSKLLPIKNWKLGRQIWWKNDIGSILRLITAIGNLLVSATNAAIWYRRYPPSKMAPSFGGRGI